MNSRKNGEAPAARDEALAEGNAIYLRPTESGKRCLTRKNGSRGLGCPGEHLYTETQKCVSCTTAELWAEAQSHADQYPVSPKAAAALGLDYTLNGRPCLHGPHLLATPNGGGRCATCEQIRTQSPRQIAKRAGETKYQPRKTCKHCGTFSLKRVDNGACDGCYAPAAREDKPASPRQHAINCGQTKYLPVDPCGHCGTVSLKRVDNARCDGCHDVAKANRVPVSRQIDDKTRLVMDGTPEDHVIPKEIAYTMGLAAYRDGKYCPEGHTGWKYLTNDKCCTCGGDEPGGSGRFWEIAK